MIKARRPDALRPLAVFLALMMLVFATVADAATCGSEQVTAGGAVVEASSSYQANAFEPGNPEDSDAPAEQHGVCAHGHCHHGSNIDNRPSGPSGDRVASTHMSSDFADLHPVDREILSPPPRA